VAGAGGQEQDGAGLKGEGGRKMIAIDKDKCNGCGECLKVCPQGAIYLKGDVAEIDRQLCVECGTCLGVCPTGAIREAVPQFAVNTGGREVNVMMGTGCYSLGYGRGIGLGMGRGFGRGVGRGMGSGMGRSFGRGIGRGMGRGFGRGVGRGMGSGMGRGQPYYPPYGTWNW
jgi:ferredoxin